MESRNRDNLQAVQSSLWEFREPYEVHCGSTRGSTRAPSILDDQPDVAAAGWEDIAELSLVLPEGTAFLNEPAGRDLYDIGPVSVEEAGGYRFRIHVSGRDSDYDLVVDSQTERHLVQLWKAPPSPMAVLSLGSAAGKSWPGFMTLWLKDLSTSPEGQALAL